MTRARTVAYWTVPSLICLLVHWQGFQAWFRADDFAWLSNFDRVHSFHDLMTILFAPQAEGTIRPFSERAFFTIGYGLFGLNALPFRIVIFATQFADLVLVALVGTRLTGSRAAGFCAAVLWTINSVSVQPLSWTCVYNEVMCAFFLLLAFCLLLRYIDTGERRYHVWQWVVFVLGFGALELNVVYPALAAAYTLLCAREFFRGTLPMVGVSIAYIVMHMLVAHPPAAGDYAMHFDPSILWTLGVYWTWSVGPVFLAGPKHIHAWALLVGIAIISIALGAFLLGRLRAGYRAAIFCIVWYLVTFAPMLPLRDHKTEYYPYIPVIGLAWLGSWALINAWGQGSGPRALGVTLALLYAAMALPRTLSASDWNRHLATEARDLMAGVERAHELHPGKAILLFGASETQFADAVRDRGFHLIGINDVYLAPGTGTRESTPGAWRRVKEFILPAGVTNAALDRDELQVYDVSGPLLRNITASYVPPTSDDYLPLRVDAADIVTAYLLGPEWYRRDGDHRWMAKRASLRMGAPDDKGRKLYLSGNSPDGLGAVSVTVTVDGAMIEPQTVNPGRFEVALPLPDLVVGKREMRVVVEVSRTFHPRRDDRDLGLSFGVFEVR